MDVTIGREIELVFTDAGADPELVAEDTLDLIADNRAEAVIGMHISAVRVALVAVTLVLIVDSLVPSDPQPAFLSGSQLRPLLSAAGQRGFQSLPPDLAASIDRLKKERPI